MTKIKLFRRVLTTILISCSLLVNAQWTQKAGFGGFTKGYWGGQSFTIDDKVFFGGGYSGNNTNYNALKAYDPTTDTWTQKNNMPGATNRSGAITFVINGKVYLGLGIQDFNSFSIPNWTFLTDLWVYNENTDSWTQKASAPGLGRGFSGVFVVDNKAYIIGGTTTKLGGGTDEVLEYDPATDKWTTKGAYPVGDLRDGPFSFTINNKGYVCGGRGPNGRTNKMYQYDPATDNWIPKKDFPLAGIAGGVSFVINNKGYCTWGGIEGGTFNSAMYAYHPDLDDWEYVSGGESIKPARMAARAEVVNNKVYLGNGWRIDGSNQSFYKDWFEFAPQGVLSVSNLNSQENTIVYPNPATNVVYVKGAKLGSEYKIYNLFGQQVLSGSISSTSSISTNSLTAGQYIIKLTNEATVNQYKVTIQ